MKKRYHLPLSKCLYALVVILLLGCGQQTTYDLVISNVNVIDGTGSPLMKGVSVGIKEGKIEVIDADSELTGLHVIDGADKYLMPGLFDCHVHTTNYEKDFPRFIHYGVTSVFITGGSLCTNEYYAAMRKQGNQDSVPAPYVFHTSQHFSMEGRHPSKTYASPNWRDGISIFYLKDTLQIEGLVKQVAQFPIRGIKLTIEDGPAPPFVERMPLTLIEKTVKEAEKNGLEVFAHVSDNIEFEMAINAGVHHLVHFTGVDIDTEDSVQLKLLEKFKAKDPGWITTLMIDKSFLYPLHPEWFELETMLPEYREQARRVRPFQKQLARIYIGILKEQYGITENSLSAFMTPQVEDIQFLLQRGFNMVLGTDTGNDYNFPGYSMHEEMQLLAFGGMPPLDIIKMGTSNAAKMMNASDSLGSVEVGKLANLILLDKDPMVKINNTLAINTVIKRGVVQERIDY